MAVLEAPELVKSAKAFSKENKFQQVIKVVQG